jgi:hypothetical protein
LAKANLEKAHKSTRILWTSPDEKWSFKKETRCGWTSRTSGCQKV